MIAPAARRPRPRRARSAQADSIVLELRRGADFATAAKRFSQDPGSKDQGGSLNWFRRGVMVPEFERVAFALKPGRGLRSGRVAVRVPHHPGRAGAAGRGAGPAHPAHAGHRLGARGQRARAGRTRCDGRVMRGALVRLAAAALPRPVGRASRRTTCRRTSCRRPTPRRSARPTPGRSRRSSRSRAPAHGSQFVVVQVTGAPAAGRHPLRGRARPHPRAARPAARHPALHRPAAAGDVRGRAVVADDGADGRWRPDLARHHPGRSARHRSRDRGARAGRAARRGDHGRGRGGPDRGDSRRPAGRRRAPGGSGAASAARRPRPRAIRAGRIAGHAVETAVKLALAGRGRRDRHRARPQARAPPRGLSLSRAHRVAGEAGGRRGRGDDARRRPSSAWCW